LARVKQDYRTGRLDRDEILFLEDNYRRMSIEMMAEKIRRRPITVKNFIENIPSAAASQYLSVLMKRPSWADLKEQFTEEELNQFANEYHGFVEQFQGEVLHSEEGQMLDAIRLGILASRKLKEEKSLMDDIVELNKEIAKEKKSKTKDMVRVNELQHDLILAKQIMDSLSDKAKVFIDAKHKVLKEMKATRSSRTDINTSAFNTSFKDWMKKLVDDRDFREEFGTYMEKCRLAGDIEYAKLRKPHKYLDGNEDLPILTAKTLELLAEDEAKRVENESVFNNENNDASKVDEGHHEGL
jgi:hypothetical protein